MTRHIKDVLVCAGARNGINPEFMKAAARMGEALGKSGYDVVYGGSNIGMMGACAAHALINGSKVTGYLASAFAAAGKELDGCTNLETLATLFLRKEAMVLASQAGIILPGGIGTLDELMEMAADNDIARYIDGNVIVKPIVVVNIDGYFDGMKLQWDRAVAEGFMNPEQLRMIHFVDSIEAAMAILDQQSLNPITGVTLSPPRA